MKGLPSQQEFDQFFGSLRRLVEVELKRMESEAKIKQGLFNHLEEACFDADVYRVLYRFLVKKGGFCIHFWDSRSSRVVQCHKDTLGRSFSP